MDLIYRCPQNLEIEGHTAKTFYLTFQPNQHPDFVSLVNKYFNPHKYIHVTVINNILPTHQYQKQSFIRLVFDEYEWIKKIGIMVSQAIDTFNKDNPRNPIQFAHFSTKQPENFETFYQVNYQANYQANYQTNYCQKVKELERLKKELQDNIINKDNKLDKMNSYIENVISTYKNMYGETALYNEVVKMYKSIINS